MVTVANFARYVIFVLLSVKSYACGAPERGGNFYTEGRRLIAKCNQGGGIHPAVLVLWAPAGQPG